jgi:hypothetical protein
LKEKRRKPASLPSGRETKVQRDARLRNLLPLLESLPEELRDALVSALEAVVRTHHLLQGYQSRTKAGKT